MTTSGSDTAQGPAQAVLTYLRARYPILYLVSHEQTRVERALMGVAQAMAMDLVFWSITTGLTDPTGAPLEASPDYRDPVAALRWVLGKPKRMLVVLRDLHAFLAPPAPDRLVVRSLGDLSRELRVTRTDEARSLVLLAPALQLPDQRGRAHGGAGRPPAEVRP